MLPVRHVGNTHVTLQWLETTGRPVGPVAPGPPAPNCHLCSSFSLSGPWPALRPEAVLRTSQSWSQPPSFYSLFTSTGFTPFQSLCFPRTVRITRCRLLFPQIHPIGSTASSWDGVGSASSPGNTIALLSGSASAMADWRQGVWSAVMGGKHATRGGSTRKAISAPWSTILHCLGAGNR